MSVGILKDTDFLESYNAVSERYRELESSGILEAFRTSNILLDIGTRNHLLKSTAVVSEMLSNSGTPHVTYMVEAVRTLHEGIGAHHLRNIAPMANTIREMIKSPLINEFKSMHIYNDYIKNVATTFDLYKNLDIMPIANTLKSVLASSQSLNYFTRLKKYNFVDTLNRILDGVGILGQNLDDRNDDTLIYGESEYELTEVEQLEITDIVDVVINQPVGKIR